MRLTRRVVATTRDGSADDPLVEGLEAEGARVLTWPTLTFVSTGRGRELVGKIASYDWIIFTSARAVAELVRAGVRFDHQTIATVGEATAAAVSRAGGEVAVRGSGGAAELVASLASTVPLAGARVLFPSSHLAGNAVESGLSAAGARVDRVNVYRTVLSAPDAGVIRADLARGVDVVTFASPSAVTAISHALGGDWPYALRGVAIAAIGPTTSHALRAVGVEGVWTPPQPGIEGLIEACVKLTRERN